MCREWGWGVQQRQAGQRRIGVGVGMGVSMGVGLSVALGMGMAMGAPSSGTEVRISHRISHENEGEEHARGALEERGSNAMEVGVGKRGLGDLELF